MCALVPPRTRSPQAGPPHQLLPPGSPSFQPFPPYTLRREPGTPLTSCCRHSNPIPPIPEGRIRACGANATQLGIHTATRESYRPKPTRQQERWVPGLSGGRVGEEGQARGPGCFSPSVPHLVGDG